MGGGSGTGVGGDCGVAVAGGCCVAAAGGCGVAAAGGESAAGDPGVAAAGLKRTVPDKSPEAPASRPLRASRTFFLAHRRARLALPGLLWLPARSVAEGEASSENKLVGLGDGIRTQATCAP